MTSTTAELQQDFQGLVAAHFEMAGSLRSVTLGELEAGNRRLSGELDAFQGKMAEAYLPFPKGGRIFALECECIRKFAADNGLGFKDLVDRVEVSDSGHVALAVFPDLKISNIDALAGLAALSRLWLNNNQIQDISALKDLTSLENLLVFSNQIKDVSALARLTSLRRLGLVNNQIEDISALKNLCALTDLGLDGNKIEDISVLENLTALELLELNHNRIIDISALENLTSLSELWIEGNRLNEASQEVVKMLEKRGVTVHD